MTAVEQIAIVGLSCRMPGAENAEKFWTNLVAGRIDITEVGQQQWDRERFHLRDSDGKARIVTDRVGALTDPHAFDHAFFGMTPRQAERTDPQYRLLLQETWHCVEDSGLPLWLLQQSRTSVNVGLMAQDHLIRMLMNNTTVDAYDPIGSSASMAANQLSFRLGLTGPSRTVDTACSASLVALAQGRSDILWEACDFALVGGVSVVGSPWRHLAFSEARMLSPDGGCFTFDARANGYVPGEGVGVVLLTTLSKAQELGCHIYGVLRGIASNHNGHNRSITSPSVMAQVDVIERALTAAATDPGDVGYVEAHGTGTSLGDPIEIEALATIYGRERSSPLVVGSVKPNIGHLEAAAGIAGFIKVLLMLERQQIVPSVGRESTNPLIRAHGERISFPDQLSDWHDEGRPRVAAVSSFGFGGVNCHAIVAEYRHSAQSLAMAPGPSVFTLAAKTPEALIAALHNWATVAVPQDEAGLAALCRTTNQRALDLPYRFAVIGPELEIALKPLGRNDVSPVRVNDSDPLTVVVRGDAPACEGPVAEQLRRQLDNARPDNAVELDPSNPLTGFTRALSWLRRFEHRGVHFAELIGADAPGTAAALVHAGAVELGAAIDALLGDGVLHLTSRPSTVVVGHSGQRWRPRELTSRYLGELFEHHGDLEQLQPYLHAAQALLGRQHTFTRAVTRWDAALAEHDITIAAVIEDSAEASPSALAVAALVIDAALTDIDETWGLSPAPWLHENIHELAELVHLDILSPADAVDGLHSLADLPAIIASAQDHHALLDTPVGKLKVLERHAARSQHRPVRLAPEQPPAITAGAGALVLAERSDAAQPGAIALSTGPDAFERTLLKLWLHGHTIDFSGPQRNSFQRRAHLPTYAFDAHTHRFADTEPRINGTMPDERGESETQPSTTLAATDDLLLPLLRRLVAEVTGIPLAQVRADSAFADLGLESIAVHRLNDELAQRFGDVAVTVFFECTDIQGVVERLNRDYADRITEHFQHAASTSHELAASAIPAATSPSGGSAAERFADRSAATTPAHPAGPRSAAADALDIAVIGVDIRAPGADTLDGFWENLCAGLDSVTEIPASRWNHADYFDPGAGVAGKVYARWGGFLSDIEHFDAAGFGISPTEARFMDPHERLFLESTRRCLQVAGYTRERITEEFDGEVGVFAGATYSNYQLLQYETSRIAPINSQTYAIANRVSYAYGLRGPSLVVDTACSSSLYAVHLACAALSRGEAALALAGGVNLSLHPSKYQMLAHYRFLSSDGRCRAYGDGGDGYVPAEAVGSFLLKPLGAAERDGDDIYGVMRGSAVTHGGRTTGFTVPSPAAQASAIGRALRQAGTAPETISYIEGHGAGTRLGDPIEVAGITAALGSGGGQHCALGSVKTNIGHAEAAAGVAQLAKVVMQLRHRTLVPSLHAETTNSAIDFARTPLYVQRELTEWQQTTGRRRAGVTSLGAGGTNVHLVMEEYR